MALAWGGEAAAACWYTDTMTWSIWKSCCARSARQVCCTRQERQRRQQQGGGQAAGVQPAWGSHPPCCTRHAPYIPIHPGMLACSISGAGMRALVITDSLFSMDGDFADLAGLARLRRQHGFLLVSLLSILLFHLSPHACLPAASCCLPGNSAAARSCCRCCPGVSTTSACC